MKITYIGETRTATTIDGNEVKLEKGMQLDCMEKEYHSATTVRAVLDSGAHIKIKRNEVQKVS